MSGYARELLLESIDVLLVRTKAAIGTNAGSFLPTTPAEEQVSKLEKAKAVVPAVDDIDRDLDVIEPLVGVLRNAVVVNIRVLNKEVRGAEVKRKVATKETDAKINSLFKIAQDLGDERDLDTILAKVKRDDDDAPGRDPNQIDIEEAVGANA